MHVAQSLQTHEELRQLASVPSQIISPRECKPIVSVVQDIVLGLYRMTKDNVRITERQLFNLVATNPKFLGMLPSANYNAKSAAPRWSGRQLLSTIIPKGINVDMKTSHYDERKPKEENKHAVVSIKNGTVMSGVFDKEVYQARTRGLIHSIYNEYGPDETRTFFDNTQKIICNWLVLNGFSVGISDLVVDDTSFQNIIHDMKVKVYEIIQNIHFNKFDNKSTKSNNDHFEKLVNDILNQANKNVGDKGLSQIDESVNRMINMIKSKSKGNTINVAQMIGCLGQQNVDGRRIPYGFDDRTLPHYAKYDDGPESRGFVENSFINGLTPQEFFFHAMGGREGLIDTAVQTSETGYIQRKLVKAMEDCKVNFDQSVRNAAGAIVQFLYGDDGMDAIKVEAQIIPTIDMDHEKLAHEHIFSENFVELENVIESDLIKALRGNEKLSQRLQDHVHQIYEDREFMIRKVFKRRMEASVMYPVSFNRIINNIKGAYHAGGCDVLLNLTPDYILDKIDELCNELYVNKNHKGNRLFQVLVRSYLSPKMVLCKHKLCKEAFNDIVRIVKQRFYASFAHPSEMVGVIAAQSIGEPSTQLTLNSVHYDTDMLLRIDGQLQRVKIGEYIEKQIASTPHHDIEQHPNDTWLGWIKNQIVEVPSCDKQGRILWTKVEAVTKHPVVNEDGSNTLLKVTLKSGREVIATKAKSFLQRVNNQIIQVEGKDIKIGDYIPVSKVLDVGNTCNGLHLAEYLSKKEFLFMTEVEKALKYVDESQWWSKHNNADFVLPYSRSDSFIVTHKNSKVQQKYQSGCIYPKKTTRTIAHVPEVMPLDADFGFFVGAYLAEGHATLQHVLIANNDDNYRQRIDAFCKKYNFNYHVTTRHINSGVSTTVRIHNLVLANVMRNVFGHMSYNKNIPAQLLAANDEFMRAMIDGYFSRDGSVRKMGSEIKADSTSRPLLETIQQILVKYDIMSGIHRHMNHRQLNKFKNEIKPSWTLLITSGNAKRFAEQFTLCIDSKQERLDKIITTSNPMYTYGRYDVIPDIALSSGKQTIHRDQLHTFLNNECITMEDQEVLQVAAREMVIYDQITQIVEIANDRPYVYDLTVEHTRNFNTYNGVCMADTFHLSGVSSASKTVRGVPRLKELLSVSKNIKTPVMKIYFKDEYSKDMKKCLELMNDIRTLRFKDIVKSSRIYFDALEVTNIPEDKHFMAMYKEFLNEDATNASLSPWLLRLEFNKAALLQYHLDMITIHHKLLEFYGDDNIACMFSDDNADKLVMRIRLAKHDTDTDDMLTELKALEHNIMENVMIKGTKNIEKVSLDKEEITVYNMLTNKFEKQEEWIVYTDGTNFRDVASLDVIDPLRTFTNDVNEVYEVLGIEAARQALFNEINEVLDSVYVNYRHIALLVDVQTNKGYILSIDRHGINRGDIGPLAKCSFEETTDKLIKAGIFAEYDKINGVSANIMLGQIAPCGTGDTEVLMDEERLMELLENNDTRIFDNMNDIDDDLVEELCDADTLAFKFDVPAIAADTPVGKKYVNKLVVV
jgi:DNA-directed RNA polymerase beta' subunit